MALAAIHVKKPREAQIWNCCTRNPVLRILPDSNIFLSLPSWLKHDLRCTSRKRKAKPRTCMEVRGFSVYVRRFTFVTKGRLLFGGEEGIPCGELYGLLLEEVKHRGGYVLLVHHDAEHVFIEPFVGHDEVALVA